MLITVKTEFWIPKAVVTDGRGGVFVACANRKGGLGSSKGGVLKYRFNGNVLEPEWSLPISSIRGLALLEDGRLYATSDQGHIEEISGDGRSVSQWGPPPDRNEGKLAGPAGIAVDGAGCIYVVESSSWSFRKLGGHRVHKFAPDRSFLLQWGGKGSGPGELNMPTGVTTDRRGRVWVADSYNSRIQVFEPDGTFVSAWGTYGIEEGFLYCPQGVAVDPAGDVWIADTFNNRIQKFTADGKFLAKWSKCGQAESQFWLPCGIAADADGTVFVADSMNGSVHAMKV